MKRIYETTFDAAHIIAQHPKCGKLHGHTYRLRVEVDFPANVWLDFGVLKNRVDTILANGFDHNVLGLISYEAVSRTIDQEEIKLTVETMTAEHLADKLRLMIYNNLQQVLECEFDVEVELWETSHFGVRA